MLVIKMFSITKAEDMNESTSKGSQLNWQESACILKKKKVYLWFLYLVIPEINCLHHNILYVLECFSD